MAVRRQQFAVAIPNGPVSYTFRRGGLGVRRFEDWPEELSGCAGQLPHRVQRIKETN